MKNKNMLKQALLALALTTFAVCGVSAQNFKETEKPYTYVEQMPAFKGGEAELLKFLGTHVKYPKEAVENGIEGLVVVTFVVETDGSLQEIQTVKSLGHGTDEEASRVVKMMSGQWTPGRQHGQAVRVRYTLPLRFALKEMDIKAASGKANRMPAFKGGQEALQQTMMAHLTLPAEAKKENLNARVVVKFTVEPDGSISNLKLEGTKLKKTVGPGSELDYTDASTFQLQNKALLAKLAEAAMSAVKATSGQWEPALQNGRPVAAELALPVQFLGPEAGQRK